MPPLQSVRILDQLKERIRYLHYSLRTEEAHVYWARAFIRFHGLRHPKEMGKAEIEAFLMALVSKRNVLEIIGNNRGRNNRGREIIGDVPRLCSQLNKILLKSSQLALMSDREDKYPI